MSSSLVTLAELYEQDAQGVVDCSRVKDFLCFQAGKKHIRDKWVSELCFCVALNSSGEKLKSQSLCSICQGGAWFTASKPLVQPVPSGSPGLPRLDRQPRTWDGEMLKETASPKMSLKPLSLGQSGAGGRFF